MELEPSAFWKLQPATRLLLEVGRVDLGSERLRALGLLTYFQQSASTVVDVDVVTS